MSEELKPCSYCTGPAAQNVADDKDKRIAELEAALQSVLNQPETPAAYDAMMQRVTDALAGAAQLAAAAPAADGAVTNYGTKVSEEEFIAGYAARSGTTAEALKKHFVALPCACGADICEGWAMVPNKPEHIEMHNRRYKPATAPQTWKVLPSLHAAVTDEQIIRAARAMDTPFGRVSMMTFDKDGNQIPTLVARQFAQALISNDRPNGEALQEPAGQKKE